MERKSVLKEKSLLFSQEIIEICRICKETKVEFALYNQMLRSGTAVGALVREAEYAQSKADFISKLSIALKEANETMYWLELLTGSRRLQGNTHAGTLGLLQEIIKMLTASLITSKQKP